MRRRRLLAALGTAASAGLAGCGYAYGGGDSRGERRVGSNITFGETLFAVAPSGILVASSGRLTVFEDEDVRFVDGTELVVASRAGAGRWRHVYETESSATALGDAAYLLDVEGRVAAFSGRNTDPDTDTVPEERRLWRTGVGGAQPPLAATGAVAYVATRSGVAAVRDGSVRWRASTPVPPETLLPSAGGVVATAAATVVAFDSDGAEQWRTNGEALVVADDRVYVFTPENQFAAYGRRRGRRLWTVDTPVSTAGIAATPDTVYVSGGASLTAIAADGTERWQASGVRPSRVVVPAPEGAYSAGRGVVQAVGPDGRRWQRDLERDAGQPIEGWLSGQRLAVLYDSGTIYWFQRRAQPRGLFSGRR